MRSLERRIGGSPILGAILGLLVASLIELPRWILPGDASVLHEWAPKGLLYVAPLLLAVAAWFGHKRLPRLQWTDRLVAAGATVAIASFLLTWKGFVPIAPALTVLGAAGFYALCRWLAPWTRGWGRTLTAAIVAVLGVEGLHAIRQHLHAAEVHGGFLNRNVLALVLSMGVPFALALLWGTGGSWSGRLIGAGGLASLLPAIYWTGCRTAWYALALTLPVLVYSRFQDLLWNRIHRWRRATFWSGFAVYAVAAAALLHRLYLVRPVSALGRILKWKVGWLAWRDHPWLGTGWGSEIRSLSLYHGRYFQLGLDRPGERMLPTDLFHFQNEYVAATVQLGLLGLIVLVPLWIGVTRRTLRGLRIGMPRPGDALAPEEAQRAFAPAGAVAIFALLGGAYFPGTIAATMALGVLSLAWLVGTTSGDVESAVGEPSEPEGTATDARGRRSLRWAATILFVLSVPFLLTGVRERRGLRLWIQAQSVRNAGNLSQASKLYAMAMPRLRNKPEFALDAGWFWIDTGRPDRAIETLETVRRYAPTPEVLEALATAQQAKGDTASAIETASEASRVYPWRLTPRWMMARWADAEGTPFDALIHARSILTIPAKVRNDRALQIKQAARRLIDSLPLAALPVDAPAWVSELPVTERSELRRALMIAGDNAQQLVRALQHVPEAQRAALVFLIDNMPASDLTTRTSDPLLADLQAAYDIRGRLPFQEPIDDELYLHYVVPYAQMNESRDAWRRELRFRLMPLVRDAKTIEDVIYALKYKALDSLGLRFSDLATISGIAGPGAVIARGTYNCYGGSILLADAYRAFGIPARVVVIPRWVGWNAGHSWVEVWVHGHWRSIGVADLSWLDEGWFLDRAAKTDVSDPDHRIYAASFERTDLQVTRFGGSVWWIDRTAHYTGQEDVSGSAKPQEGTAEHDPTPPPVLRYAPAP